MLESQTQPHREYLLANTPGQKLFVALRLKPLAEAAAARAQLSVAFVVDTSGSMREVVTEPTERTGETVQVDGNTYEVVRGAKTKMDLVVDSLLNVLQSPLLLDSDRLALVQFDDNASVVQSFSSAQNRRTLVDAAERLRNYSGGTHMGAGMAEAMKLLAKEQGNRRMILLTDGQTFDEPVVEQITQELTEAHIPVTAIGVGDEWNDDLLLDITDRTQGKPLHVVPDTQKPQPPSLLATELPKAVLEELKQAATEVITNVGLSVRMVKEVVLERITRVYPEQTEVERNLQPHPLGNVKAGDWTVYILEFTLPARPAARLRLAQLGITYEVPGKGYRGEIPPVDVVVEFTADETLASQIDPQIMQWVQQRNIEALVKQATAEARNNPEKAAKTLALAHTLSQRVGQTAMTQALERAALELKEKQALSPHMQKTLRVGAKTQTLSANPPSLPSDEEIRRATGG